MQKKLLIKFNTHLWFKKKDSPENGDTGNTLRAKLHQSCRLFATLWHARLFWPWDSPGKNTGMGCHSFLQGTFPNQGLNPHFLPLLHTRQIPYCWDTGAAQEETYLNIIKDIYDKPAANIILNGGKAESISSKTSNKTRMPTLAIFIQHSNQKNRKHKL